MNAAYLLDAGTTISCAHGATVLVQASAKRVKLGGQPPILSLDRMTIPSCPFNAAGSPSPCFSIAWSGVAEKVTLEGGAPLLSTSVGVCSNPAGAPQGNAVVKGFQTRVTAK